MKKCLLTLLAVAFSFSAQAAVQEIDISEMRFNPNVIDINQGDTVRWINRGDMPHTIQGDFGGTTMINPGDRYEFTFTSAGNFDYICSLHPSMTGTVRVAAVTVINDEADDLINFNDLFGNDSFEPDNLATVEQPFENNEPAEIAAPPLGETPPAPTPEVEPVVSSAPEVTESSNNTAIFNPTPEPRSVAVSTEAGLPTTGGDNLMVILAVLGTVTAFFFLAGNRR